jgi:hypothetical protein
MAEMLRKFKLSVDASLGSGLGCCRGCCVPKLSEHYFVLFSKHNIAIWFIYQYHFCASVWSACDMNPSAARFTDLTT